MTPVLSPHAVFAYGTLIDVSCRQAVLGYDVETVRAVLAGYRKYDGKWPYILPDQDDAVTGVVLATIDADDLAKLDGYEDISDQPSRGLYERVKLDVQLEFGHTASTWVYRPLLQNWHPSWLGEPQ